LAKEKFLRERSIPNRCPAGEEEGPDCERIQPEKRLLEKFVQYDDEISRHRKKKSPKTAGSSLEILKDLYYNLKGYILPIYMPAHMGREMDRSEERSHFCFGCV